jgi:hypothetical protein
MFVIHLKHRGYISGEETTKEMIYYLNYRHLSPNSSRFCPSCGARDFLYDEHKDGACNKREPQ